MKISIFGLSADPVTSAHLEIIEKLSKSYDKVFVIPTNVNYYKNYKGHDRAMFSFAERYDNLVEKCKPFSNVIVNDIERDIKDGWRFYHTLLAVIDNINGQAIFNPTNYKNIKDNESKLDVNNVKSFLKMIDVELYVAIGSDSLQNFKTWWRWEDILKISKLVVFNRPGYTDGFPEDIEYEYIDMNNDASSTKVRKNLLALMDKFEDEIEEDDFDTWLDDMTWAKDYRECESF